jgi:hypothetical protein
MPQGVPGPPEMQDAIRREADAQGLDPAVPLGVVERESSFLPNQLGPEVMIPHSGGQTERAVGPFQFLPSTARSRGFDPYDQGANIHEGVRYLKELLDKHQDPYKALAEYGGVKHNTTYVPNALTSIQSWQQRLAKEATLPPRGAPAPIPNGWDDEHPNLAPLADAAGSVAGFGRGILKGAASTALNLGELVHKIPGVREGVDALYGTPGLSAQAFGEGHRDAEAHGTAENIGKFGEQFAELAVPSSLVGEAATKAAALFPRAPLLARMAVEAAGGAGMSAAQGGDATTGAAFGAAMPAVGAGLGAARDFLKDSAVHKMSQALLEGGGTQRVKAIAGRIIPDVIKRGIRGSREEILQQAEAGTKDFGQQIGDLIDNIGPDRFHSKHIWLQLEAAKDKFRDIVNVPVSKQYPAGQKWVVKDARAIAQLDKLIDTVKDYGKVMTVEHARGLRQTWDAIVDQAGGFANRVPGTVLGLNLADQTEAAMTRLGRQAIRNVLDAKYPDLAALDKEYSFWKNLGGVVKSTIARKASHGGGLSEVAAERTGQLGGWLANQGAGVAKRSMLSWTAGTVMKLAHATIASPGWRSASAIVRDRMADALANQDLQAMARLAAEAGVVGASKLTADEPPPPPHTPGSEISLTLQSDKPSGPPPPPFKNVLGNRPRGGPPAPPR